MSFLPPVLITAEHQVESFDCGKESLNQYLRRFALTNTAAGTARTYVSTSSQEMAVVGYYSLAAGSVEKATVPARMAKGIPNHPVPVVLLARLAVDRRFQGKGSARPSCTMRWRELSRRPKWSGFGLCSSTPRTRKLRNSTASLVSPLPLQTRFT